MKKRLLCLGLAVGLISFKASAQLALEDFNAGYVLPTGWVLINDGHTVSTSFTGSTAIQDSLNNHAWWPFQIKATGDYSMITTSLFTPAATADRWLITPSFAVTSANMAIQWDDNDLNSGEYMDLKVSPTAGTTIPSFTKTLYVAKAGNNSWVTHQVLVGAYMSSNIRIAFRDSINNNWGMCVDNVKTVILPSYDMKHKTLYAPPFAQTGSTIPISGIMHNNGVVTITSMNIDYSVNGVLATPTTALTGLSIPLNTDYSYTSTNPWTPSAPGTYTIKVWASNLNGPTAHPDEDNTNDTLTATIYVVDALQPKTVMIEEFTQASCDPCANAAPNVDSVYANNTTRSILVRYHVNFPGRDCMDTVTLSPFVQARLTQYAVGGVPDAQVDGQYVYPGAGSFTTPNIMSYAALKSPLSITVTAKLDSVANTYTFSSTIKSFGAIPAGLKARAVLAVDNLTYTLNQSTESIPQYVFPEVAENMFPNPSGTALGAFTTGSTQTFTGTWVKNHAWGSARATWKYDSSAIGKLVVWVEDDSRNYVWQAGFTDVNVIHPTVTGVNAVVGIAGRMDLYPNPASNTATVALSLNAASDVSMEVYDMTGKLMYSMPTDHRNSGVSHTTLDLSNFASAQYIVKVTVNNEVLTKTLSVVK